MKDFLSHIWKGPISTTMGVIIWVIVSILWYQNRVSSFWEVALGYFLGFVFIFAVDDLKKISSTLADKAKLILSWLLKNKTP